MSREIKFRVWDSVNNYMVEPSKYLLQLDGRVFFNNDGDLIDQTDKLVLMQFTGLTDKKGKEIFVGDIISRNDVYSAYIHTVTFDKGKFIASNRIRPESYKWLSDNSASYDLYFLFSSIKDFEIIGNIHEHPELLK